MSSRSGVYLCNSPSSRWCQQGKPVESPLRRTGFPALLLFAPPELDRLLTAELLAAFEQRHRLIRQQLSGCQLQPLHPAIPAGGPKVQNLPSVADPALPGRERRPRGLSMTFICRSGHLRCPALASGHVVGPALAAAGEVLAMGD